MFDIIKILELLEGLHIYVESTWREGDETGHFFNYELVSDIEIKIECGFTDYEEGSHTDINIVFNEDVINLVSKGEGYSAGGGDYSNAGKKEFKTTQELIKYLQEM